MSDGQRLLLREIESPPENALYRRLSVASDGRQGEAPTLSNSPNDRAWAIAFKMNVAITAISISVRATPIPRPSQVQVFYALLGF